MPDTSKLMSLISKYGDQREERALPFNNTSKEMVKDTIEQLVAEIGHLMTLAGDHARIRTLAEYATLQSSSKRKTSAP